MKIFLKPTILFLLGSALSAFTGMSQELTNPSQDASVVAAIKTLKDSKLIKNPGNWLGIDKNTPRGKAFWALYNAQTDAITVLGNAKIPGTAGLLLPYLNYPSTHYRELHISHLGDNTNTNKTFLIWPVLVALKEIPGSSEALASYALDRNNTVNARFAAFVALKYIDQNQFSNIAASLSEEFSTSNYKLGVIQIFKSGDRPYMGYYPVESPDKGDFLRPGFD